MRGVNKVILIGNLGADPEVKYSQSGAAHCSLSVATTRSWKDRDGQKQEETEWHRCKAFGQPAEFAGKFLAKGAKVYIEGRLQTRKWQDDKGQDRWTTEIIIFDLQALGEAGSADSPRREGGNPNPPDERPRDDLDDDIPFAVALAPLAGALLAGVTSFSGGVPGVS